MTPNLPVNLRRYAEMRIAERQERQTAGQTIAVAKQDNIKRLLRVASRTVAPMVRQMLFQNYSASGIGQKDSATYHQTGAMRDAILNSRVTLYRTRTGDLKIWARLPGGVAPLPNQNGKAGGFYKAFSALNYGAVHGTGGRIGARGKISLKRASFSGQELSTAGGKRRKLTSKIQALKEIGKSLTIRKAHLFYRLTPPQLSQIRAVVFAILQRRKAA